ncbi:MAG TPA: hypothetical protein VGJ27_04170 [Gaiellaceae bacterium]|jgi:hypothetical protein
MSFTEVFGFAEGGEPEKPGEPLRPPWLGPPDDELGVAIPEGIVLARSEHGAIGLSHAIAHPSGVVFEFLAQARGLTHAQANRLFHEQHTFGDDEELLDGFLRLGMELPSGARVSNLGGRRAHRKAMSADEEPEGPFLFPHAGGGGMSGGDRVVMHPAYWLWPLPESGPLRISCEWPVVEIALTTVEINGGALVAAAANSTKLWPSA